jgi:Na+/H+ antiporter NhaD/arsenite permease-like protein
MKGDDQVSLWTLRHGPMVWGLSLVMGFFAGVALTRLLPPAFHPDGTPIIHLWMAAPFAVLLTCIAIFPLVATRVWHRHFPDVALGLGGLVAGYYLAGYGAATPAQSYGPEKVLHALLEFYAFIALVGGLYVVSGTVLIDLKGRATPLVNTALLAIGAILANVVGTTGASVLLIRPLLRLNEGRVRPIHVVLFIFIVSNCGGCILPIGDPPLYLGFIKGVPFLWTFHHLLPDWLITVLPLLAVFFTTDSVLARRDRAAAPAATPVPAPTPSLRLSIQGARGVVCLLLMVAGVFIDPLLERFARIHGVPIGATFQLLVGFSAYRSAPKSILSANEFSFFPVKEVGLLFVGIFLTMIPALGYLSSNGTRLGLDSSTSYYFSTGILSAFLDNAPTYLNFLQVALAPNDLSHTTIRDYIATHDGLLHVRGISTGAVFFGAMTYIGNGPNFMVRAIAQSAGIKMPSFFAYIGWALLILLPILAVHWAVLIR